MKLGGLWAHVQTVERHRARIMLKLNLVRSLVLAQYAIRARAAGA